MDWLDLLAVQGTLKSLLHPPSGSGCLSHGTSGGVGIQGEEVWLQSLGSDLQTREGFQTDPHSLGGDPADMFLFSNFKFKCLLRITWASLVAQMVKNLAYNVGDLLNVLTDSFVKI